MKHLKDYNIQFVGLKDGIHHFKYKIEQRFFDAFEFNEYEITKINVTVVLEKKPTLLKLDFYAEGFVNVPCDVTGELFDLEISGSFPLLIKFGNEFNDDNDEILTISHHEYKVNIAQYIYELIVLSVPIKRVDPQVKSVDMQIEPLEKLGNKHNENEVEHSSIDPRWDKLKDLLTGKNE